MIRRARPEDADAIATTYAAAFEPLLAFLPDLHTRDDWRRFITEEVPRDHELWVAEDAGRVIGFAAIGETTLGHIYVHPDFHGRGFGTALLDKTKELRPSGFTLWTFPANEGACRFYERRGLRVIEYGDGSGNEEGVPDVRYEWMPTRPARGVLALPPTSSARGERVLLHVEDRACDHEPLDLARPLVDLGDLRIAVVALHRELLRVAVAAEYLDRLTGLAPRDLGREKLGLRACL